MKVGASYFGNRGIKHVEKDLIEMKKSGLDSVLHTFSEHDMNFNLESMKEIVKQSHDIGLEVTLSPWGLGGIFGGEAYSEFASQNYDEWQVLNDGKHVPNICLNSNKLLILMRKWIDNAKYIGADIVMWDEPHFKRTNKKEIFACRCESCKKKFKKEFKYDMPNNMNDDIEKFRRDSIKNLIKNISKYAKEKGLKVSCCLLPVMRNKQDRELWEKVSSSHYVDILSTDPYWMFGEEGLDEHYKLGVRGFVEYFSKLIYKLCKGNDTEPQIWIQNFLIKDKREKEIKIAVETAYECGIRNIFAWSYMGTENMSCISSDNPKEAWDNYIKTIADLKNKGE